MKTLVQHGAPERILIDSKPHLGTDRLVRILKDLRHWLMEKGAVFRFSTKVDDIILSSQENVKSSNSNSKTIVGVKLSTGTIYYLLSHTYFNDCI